MRRRQTDRQQTGPVTEPESLSLSLSLSLCYLHTSSFPSRLLLLRPSTRVSTPAFAHVPLQKLIAEAQLKGLKIDISIQNMLLY